MSRRKLFSITRLWEITTPRTYTSIKVRSKNNMTIRCDRLRKDTKTYVETILSPVPAIALMARNWADCPDEVATAVTPPSSAAIRFSNTSYRLSVRSEVRTTEKSQCNIQQWGCRCANKYDQEPWNMFLSDRGKMGCRDATSIQTDLQHASGVDRWVADGIEEENGIITALSLKTKLVEA